MKRPPTGAMVFSVSAGAALAQGVVWGVVILGTPKHSSFTFEAWLLCNASAVVAGAALAGTFQDRRQSLGRSSLLWGVPVGALVGLVVSGTSFLSLVLFFGSPQWLGLYSVGFMLATAPVVGANIAFWWMVRASILARGRRGWGVVPLSVVFFPISLTLSGCGLVYGALAMLANTNLVLSPP